MTRVGLARHDQDLQGILALQEASREPTPDGFVTVKHNLEILQTMHRIAPSVVAWDEHDQIVAYAITMPQEARQLVPILEPMFQMLETLPIRGSWYVMGQVAVAPSQRGQGVFDALYHQHRDRYAKRWDQIITEVATRNGRSMRAHQRVGFRTIKTFRDQTDEWAVSPGTGKHRPWIAVGPQVGRMIPGLARNSGTWTEQPPGPTQVMPRRRSVRPPAGLPPAPAPARYDSRQ